MATLFSQSTSTTPVELIGVVFSIRHRWGTTILAELDSGDTVRGPDDDEELAEGGTYRFIGRWSEHEKYGRQFAFDTFAVDLPLSREAVLTYLERAIRPVPELNLRSVSPRAAAALWEAFGAKTLDTLRDDPALAVSFDLLDADTAAALAQRIKADAGSLQAIVALSGLFKGRGFRKTLPRDVVNEWGPSAAIRVRRDPFKLLVHGFKSCGYKRCDKLYLDMKLPAGRLKRRMLAIWHDLETDMSGHTWFPFSRVDVLAPKRAIELGLRSGWLASHQEASGRRWISEGSRAAHEALLADSVRRLCGWNASRGEQAATLWPDVDECEGLSEHQREKLGEALRSPLGILCGTPGTGKTFTAAALIMTLMRHHEPASIAVCAPTGKAAVRCAESLAKNGIRKPTSTIHRLLRIMEAKRDGWTFEASILNPLDCRFLIIDETSMLDTNIAACLLSALRPGTHVLMIGDPYQLPPVGHGAPLRDMRAAGVPCGELSEIRRNAGMIVHACAAIKGGQRFETCGIPEPEDGDNLLLLPTRGGAESIETLMQILRKLAVSKRYDPVLETQILVALNGKSPLARTSLNRMLQGELNPHGKNVKPNQFRVGDKLICLKNGKYNLVGLDDGPFGDADPADPKSYYSLDGAVPEFVANGELGRVLAVGEKVTIAAFDAPRRVIRIPMGKEQPADDGDEYRTGTGCNFDLGYALTCHKLQGSEAPCVIVLIDEAPGARMVCTREWTYTAISRASQLCILVGSKETLEGYCRRTALEARKTFLKELITEGLKE